MFAFQRCVGGVTLEAGPASAMVDAGDARRPCKRPRAQVHAKDLQKEQAVAATGEADLHWKAEHPQTRHAVSVTKKQDRQVLIVINEQRKQVCQLTVESFFDNTPAGERLAFDVMREVAQEFVAGKLEGKAELAARRDAILAARGHARRGRIMRRPAAGPLLRHASEATVGDGREKDEFVDDAHSELDGESSNVGPEDAEGDLDDAEALREAEEGPQPAQAGGETGEDEEFEHDSTRRPAGRLRGVGSTHCGCAAGPPPVPVTFFDCVLWG